MFDQAFWVLIAFVIFVSISFRSAKKLIISGLDRRTEEIKKRLQEAENIRNEAKKILGVNIKKLETAKNGVATILSEANKEAEMQKKKALENLNNSMERNKDQLQDRIQKNEKET
ncbi:MAG: ATP synthase F0 subunit B, partial [Pseudomonadota bacterium]|nr:ATP synthase F0 subunit B [Pseudomonadota bacterium]